MAAPEAKEKRFEFDIWKAILIVIVTLLSYFYEDIKQYVPWLISWQLETYNWISEVREPRSQFVTAVEIDDKTFYGYLGNQALDVTHRSALAELVRIATAQHAAVIALDINLDQSSIDETSEKQGNDELNRAMRDAANAGIPVVLVFGFQEGKPVASNFFQAAELVLPAGYERMPRVGFDHAPDDLRKVPLVVGALDKEKQKEYLYPSFALQVVGSYEESRGLYPRTRCRLCEQLAAKEFVYTSFLKRNQFRHISAADLLCSSLNQSNDPKSKSGHDAGCTRAAAYESANAGNGEKGREQQECPDESWIGRGTGAARSIFSRAWRGIGSVFRDKADCTANCRTYAVAPGANRLAHSIVLIGGNRHGSPEGIQNWIDNHPSPVGCLRGMYFQANYVEGLLDNRVRKTVPACLAALLDLLLAVVMLYYAEKAASLGGKLRVLLIFCVPVILAYVAVVNLGYALDFMLPLVLLFLHPALERYLGLLHRSHA
jgi:CHASE2 domain-containing sensor protein